MMKKRLISRKDIERAYTLDMVEDMDLDTETIAEKVERLPEEMFQILGEIILFIENTNKFEGEKVNENK